MKVMIILGTLLSFSANNFELIFCTKFGKENRSSRRYCFAKQFWSNEKLVNVDECKVKVNELNVLQLGH